MSASPEQGNGWRVERGFISPQYAQHLGEQALTLIADPHLLIETHDEDDHTGLIGVTTYEAKDWDTPEWPDNPLAEYLQGTIPDLIKVTSEIKSGRGGHTDDWVVLNHYDAGGFFRTHRDIDTVDRDVISLIRNRYFIVIDPVTYKVHGFELEPGDKVTIENSGLYRPRHRASNPSRIHPCLSVVK